jgi:ATP-dependent protease ClpP protease subunit
MAKMQAFSEGGVHNLLLYGDIDDCEQFSKHYKVLITAKPEDTIYIHINSNGGDVSTAIEYIKHIKTCKAKVIALLGVYVGSAATMIALNCYDMQANDYTEFFIHGIQHFLAGDIIEIKKAAKNTKHHSKLIEEIYKDFLTPKEIKSIKSKQGKEIIIIGDDITKRWKRVMDSREQDSNISSVQ